MQNSLHLLCCFAILRGKKCKIAYIYCAFAIWRAKKCKIAYIYCVFCKSEHSKVQNNLYLLCVLQSGEPNNEKSSNGYPSVFQPITRINSKYSRLGPTLVDRALDVGALEYYVAAACPPC